MNRPPKIILITKASTGFGNLPTKLLATKGHAIYATKRDDALQNFGLSQLNITN